MSGRSRPRRHTRAHSRLLIAASILACSATTAATTPHALRPAPEAPIPAFSRKYRTTCSTCHTAAPKLNVLGEAFRLNGYRFPENDALLRRDEPVPLGEDPWKDLWPRAIWPGELPAAVPLALRIQNDVQVSRGAAGGRSWSYRFPHEIYLLAGTTLGEGVAAFLELEWSRERGTQLVQAKLEFQDFLPILPPRALNLWVGLQNLYLFTFADRQIDRAARENFLWQQFRASDLELGGAGRGARSANEFQLRQSQPALELNGLAAAGRLFYAVGLAQGAGAQTADNNNHKDIYYKLRYKLGGLRLDGTYPPGGRPVTGGRGQLMDRSIILEHFGYAGAEPVARGSQDRHRAFGVNARTLYGPLDLGFGWMAARNENPWGPDSPGALSWSSLFGKAEVLFLPWLIGSLKLDYFTTDASAESDFTVTDADQTRVLPGLVLLVRQNVRAVVEGDLYASDAPPPQRDSRRPHSLWIRLDVAF
ncbi:MAG: hypothetical protein HY561_08115 [Gemmatimonadetes bacterium]|nr:hypothetical protein [Gemmatimonadota bacterium]